MSGDTKLARALADALHEAGYEFDAAICLVGDGKGHIEAAMTGDTVKIAHMLVGALKSLGVAGWTEGIPERQQ